MKNKSLGEELIEAAQAMIAHAKGETSALNYATQHFSVPPEVDVKEIRSSLHFTQEELASFMGASVHAVRHWENGRRQPEGPARVLLQVMYKNPTAVMDALRVQ
jgi:putative transcriptional regulator